MNELEIITRLRSGDESAFREFVEEYQSRIFNGAFKFVRNTEAAEDITQEVFIETFESIRSFRGESKISTWLYRIMVAKSLNWIRKSRRKKRYGLLLFFSDEGILQPMFRSAKDLPEEELIRLERAEVLTKALDRLPENQRTAFTLHKIEELSYEEIASVLDVSHSAVESLIHRAKNNLRSILSDYYKEQR